ncbi:hypothetical protein HK100_010307, partial [Physocladia obscura]
MENTAAAAVCYPYLSLPEVDCSFYACGEYLAQHNSAVSQLGYDKLVDCIDDKVCLLVDILPVKESLDGCSKTTDFGSASAAGIGYGPTSASVSSAAAVAGGSGSTFSSADLSATTSVSAAAVLSSEGSDSYPTTVSSGNAATITATATTTAIALAQTTTSNTNFIGMGVSTASPVVSQLAAPSSSSSMVSIIASVGIIAVIAVTLSIALVLYRKRAVVAPAAASTAISAMKSFSPSPPHPPPLSSLHSPMGVVVSTPHSDGLRPPPLPLTPYQSNNRRQRQLDMILSLIPPLEPLPEPPISAPLRKPKFYYSDTFFDDTSSTTTTTTSILTTNTVAGALAAAAAVVAGATPVAVAAFASLGRHSIGGSSSGGRLSRDEGFEYSGRLDRELRSSRKSGEFISLGVGAMAMAGEYRVGKIRISGSSGSAGKSGGSGSGGG